MLIFRMNKKRERRKGKSKVGVQTDTELRGGLQFGWGLAH